MMGAQVARVVRPGRSSRSGRRGRDIELTAEQTRFADEMAARRWRLNRVLAGTRNDRIHRAPDMDVDRIGARGALAFCLMAGLPLDQHSPLLQHGVAKGGIVLEWRGERIRVASSRHARASYVQRPGRPFDVDLAVLMVAADGPGGKWTRWRLAGWLTKDDFRRYALAGNLGQGGTIVVARRFLRPAGELWARPRRDLEQQGLLELADLAALPDHNPFSRRPEGHSIEMGHKERRVGAQSHHPATSTSRAPHPPGSDRCCDPTAVESAAEAEIAQ